MAAGEEDSDVKRPPPPVSLALPNHTMTDVKVNRSERLALPKCRKPFSRALYYSVLFLLTRGFQQTNRDIRTSNMLATSSEVANILLVKTFSASQQISALQRTQNSISVFKKVHKSSLFRDISIQHTSSDHISLSSILILSSYLRLVPPSALFNSYFFTEKNRQLCSSPLSVPNALPINITSREAPHGTGSSLGCRSPCHTISVSNRYLASTLPVTSYKVTPNTVPLASQFLLFIPQPKSRCYVFLSQHNTASHFTAVPNYLSGCVCFRPQFLFAVSQYQCRSYNYQLRNIKFLHSPTHKSYAFSMQTGIKQAHPQQH